MKRRQRGGRKRSEAERRRAVKRLAPVFFVPLLACGNCEIDADPIPGGFDPSARIERAAQIRLTSSGVDALELAVDTWIKEAAELSCSTDADCPAALGASCVNSACTPGSYASIDLPEGRVFVAIDQTTLDQSPPSSLIATITARIASTDLVASGCTAMIAPQGPAPITAELAMAPSSDGSFAFSVARVTLPSLTYSGSCGAAVLQGLQTAIETSAVTAVRDLTATAVGQPCDVDADCASTASCLAERCFEGDQILLPSLADEERVTVPPVLDTYVTGDAVSDLAIQVGGAISADLTGVTAGIRAGMELVTPNSQCANVQPSPRLRPTFVAPSPLPATDAVDLDFDGVAETPYQVAFSLSKALIDQAVWSAYGGGLVCGALTTADYDELHTGTLELIIPSIRVLTKSNLTHFERPARISAWLQQEPQITIGSGETRESGGNTEYVDPLIHLHLNDLEINLSALIEERWVRVVTVTLDLHLGVAVMVTPDNELEPIIGVGVPQIISNVRITNNELLQEDPASIAQAIPTLLSFALLEFAGSAGQFEIPTLEGTDLDVLGILGVPSANGFDQIALYSDLTVSLGNLSAAAETEAELVEVRTPKTEEFAVGNLKLPEVELALGGKGTGTLEYQTRVDGGFWSGFGTNRTLVVSRPELAIQGRHRIEVRARVKGDYRSLDPTPAAIDFWVDSEPPVLTVEDGLVTATDRISDRITVEAIRADRTDVLALDADGHARIGDGVLRVRATDEAGLTSEVVLAEAPDTAESASGCSTTNGGGGLALLLGLVLLIRRRRS